MRALILLLPVAAIILALPSCKNAFESCSDCAPAAEGDGDGDNLGGGENLGGNPEPGSGGGSSPGGAGGVVEEGCPSTQILCEGECIDPLTSAEFCGASGTCQGVSAGVSCAPGDRCDGDGGCILDCPPGMIDCEGECTDPASDEVYCGASGACDRSANWGDVCDPGELCSGGTCRSWGTAIQLRSATTVYAWQASLGASGDAMVVWIEGASHRYRYYRPDATGWRALDDLSGTTMQGTWTTLGVSGAGNAVAMRAGSYDSLNHTRETHFDADGETWSPIVSLEEDVGPVSSGSPRLAMEPDGGATASWRTIQDPDGDSVWVQSVSFLPAGETTWSIPVSIGEGVGNNLSFDVARRAGVSALVWGGEDEATLSARVHAAGDWSQVGLLSERAGTTVKFPQVEVDDAGNALAVWVESAFGEDTIWSSSYSAASETWSGSSPVFEEVGLVLSDLDFRLSGEGQGLMLTAGTQDAEPYWTCAHYALGEGWDVNCDPPVTAASTTVLRPSLSLGGEPVVHAVWSTGTAVQSSIYDLRTRSWNEVEPVSTHEDPLDWLMIEQDAEGKAMAFWGYYLNTTGRIWTVRFE